MSERINNISRVSPYDYNKNSSADSKNIYIKKEETFQEILEEKTIDNKKSNIMPGLKVDSKYKELLKKGNDDLSYPIKYACIPIYYTNEADNTLGYIASKVFIVEIHEIYLPDSNVYKRYNVVCPYFNINNITGSMNIPIFIENICVNYITVDKVFDNYKYAKDECFEKNKDLNIDKSTIDLLDIFEEFVFQKTKNLNNSKTNKKLTYNTN